MLTELHYSFRPATLADIAFLFGLYKTTMREAIEKTWGPWDEALQHAEFMTHFRPGETLVLLAHDRPIGRLVIQWSAEGAFVSNLEVLPEMQRQGLGTMIMLGLLKEARRRHVPIEFQILKANPAVEFYRKLGFGVAGESATHYLMRAT